MSTSSRTWTVIALKGIYLLKRAFQARYGLSIWIERSFDTALDRAISRAQEARGYVTTLAHRRGLAEGSWK